MPNPHPLGAYLRARRELLSPDDVGLPAGTGVRRVAGLRRSEVATLAGISTEYYVKLEQGQEANPTDQVLDALSRALKLDATAHSYLYSLAHPVSRLVAPRTRAALERASWLINSWPLTAAMIINRHDDIVATNALMNALIPAYQPGANCLVALLLDPQMRELYLDWDGLTDRSVALLRSRMALDPHRVRGQQLVVQLTRESERFRQLWNRHDIIELGEGTHPIDHPQAGSLDLLYSHVSLPGTDDHTLFVYYAEPGSETGRKLAELVADR